MTLAPEPVLLDVSPEGVAVVTLNRPDKHNAFDELMIANLAEHFRDAERRRSRAHRVHARRRGKLLRRRRH